MKAEDCVLFSGAANGAEAAFGAAAERHGIDEVNLTFSGHNDSRTRGTRVLTHEELLQGDVSLEYVSRLMNRKYHDTALMRKILQSIWHQVNSEILEDGTVKGGTGWGAEFAKLCNKPLFAFAQGQDQWFRWSGAAWVKEQSPRISHVHFTGTGTRTLKDNGLKAINELFARSF